MKALKSSEGFQMFVPVFSATRPSPEECRKIEESEETLMKHQACLAHWLKTSTARRLLAEAQSSTADNSDGKSGTIVVRRGKRVPRIRDVPVELQRHEESRVVKLFNVKIFPVTGEQPMGYLEGHINGFIFTDSSGSMVIMNSNVERYFMRLGDMMMPPLLQFHLQHPMMVGTKETKDIQFFLEPPYSSHNDALKNFVRKVQNPEDQCFKPGTLWSPIRFEALQEFEFCGASPTHASSNFPLTFSALVMLNETPFVVVLLPDIEIVNLAQREPEVIDMTVVFKDFKRDVLEIHSIPIEFLAGIKFRLNYGGVKYFVNNSERRDWNMLLKDIRDFPNKFIDSGGWRSLGLEDNLTLAYYKDAESDLDSALPRKHVQI